MFTCADVGVRFSTFATCFGYGGDKSLEHLRTLQERPKWNQIKRNLKVNNIVLIEDDNAPQNVWLMGVVTKVEPDTKGLVRSVLLRTHTSELYIPVNKLILLLSAEERMDAAQDKDIVADKLK